MSYFFDRESTAVTSTLDPHWHGRRHVDQMPTRAPHVMVGCGVCRVQVTRRWRLFRMVGPNHTVFGVDAFGTTGFGRGGGGGADFSVGLPRVVQRLAALWLERRRW